MKSIKYFKISGLCLGVLCSLAVFALGAGSASAKVLLFAPSGGTFLEHFTGLGGASTLEQKGGLGAITSPDVHALALILSATLFDTSLTFLGTKTVLGSCTTAGNSTGVVSANLLGHLGLADPGDVPAVLLLIPGSIQFSCVGLGTVVVLGSVIGAITNPGVLGAAGKTLSLQFTQSGGAQQLSTFLLGNQTLTNQNLQSSLGGGALTQSGQQASATLTEAGTGTFTIIDE